jgi:hypothetical protein
MYNTKDVHTWEDPKVDGDVLKFLNIGICQSQTILEREDEEYNKMVSRPIHKMFYGH